MQLVPPVRPLYVPATHDVHTTEVFEDVAEPYRPALQAVHALAPVVNALYRPTAHSVQALAPPADPKVPAAQAAHTKDVDAAAVAP